MLLLFNCICSIVHGDEANARESNQGQAAKYILVSMHQIEFQIVIRFIRIIINTINTVNVQIDLDLCLIDERPSAERRSSELDDDLELNGDIHGGLGTDPGAGFNGRADGFTRIDSARPVVDQ